MEFHVSTGAALGISRSNVQPKMNNRVKTHRTLGRFLDILTLFSKFFSLATDRDSLAARGPYHAALAPVVVPRCEFEAARAPVVVPRCSLKLQEPRALRNLVHYVHLVCKRTHN